MAWPIVAAEAGQEVAEGGLSAAVDLADLVVVAVAVAVRVEGGSRDSRWSIVDSQ